MSFNTVQEIITDGRLSLEDFNQSQIENAIDASQEEIDMRVPPLAESHKWYSVYSRRLSTLKEAHLCLTLSRLYKTSAYEYLVRGDSGNPWSVEGFNQGAYTPEKNVMHDTFIRLAKEYKDKADELLKLCHYVLPSVRRPRPLEI